MDCPRCRIPLSTDGENLYCPICGFNMINPEIPPPYSGSIAFQASTCFAHEQIAYVKNMLLSVTSSYQYSNLSPIIKELERVEKITKEQDEKITHLEKTQNDLVTFKKVLEDYKKLVDDFRDEPIYQDFLKSNPNIMNINVKQTYSKYKLADEYIPDFLLILHDSIHIFVEIETPSKKIFNQDGSESSDYRKAISQVRGFVTWVSGELEFLRRRECPNINTNNIRGLLVMGHSGDFSREDKKLFERINYEFRGLYEIKTFDELYYDRLNNLKNLGFS